MKRIYILVLVLLSTTVSANKVYLINNSETYNITNNDRYNYEDYIISSNMELNVSASDGILSNDIIKDKNYKIIIEEDSINAKRGDLSINKDGSFIYKPSSRVYGEVTFKYHLLSNNVKSNSSTIKFYVRSVVSIYTINCYELNTNKLLTTYTKKALVNDEITEMYPKIKSYSIVSNRELTKKISIKKEENIYNFYYEKVPKTGLNFLSATAEAALELLTFLYVPSFAKNLEPSPLVTILLTFVFSSVV